MNCTECDREVQYPAHGLCNTHYMRWWLTGSLERTTWAREDLLGEVVWLIEGGETDDGVAARLGVTVGAIERAAYRAGDVQLGRRFGHTGRQARRAKRAA